MAKGGRAADGRRNTGQNLHTHTMATNPEILMPIVAHQMQRRGVCGFEVSRQITHTPLLLVKKVAVKGYPIPASPLSPHATTPAVIMYAY